MMTKSFFKKINSHFEETELEQEYHYIWNWDLFIFGGKEKVLNKESTSPMLDLQECNEATELHHRWNEACCLCFSRVTSCRLELDGAVLSISRGKARPSAGTKASFLTPTCSALLSHVQLTQAQHTLPCPIIIPVLALRLAWYRIFLSNSNLLPLILKLEFTSFSSSQWLQVVAQPQLVRCGKPSAQMALPAWLAAVFLYFFPNPSNDKVRTYQKPPLLWWWDGRGSHNLMAAGRKAGAWAVSSSRIQTSLWRVVPGHRQTTLSPRPAHPAGRELTREPHQASSPLLAPARMKCTAAEWRKVVEGLVISEVWNAPEREEKKP